MNSQKILLTSTIMLVIASGLFTIGPLTMNAQGQTYSYDYGNDHYKVYPDSKKGSADVNIQKIKCVNSNVNVNGIDITELPQDGVATSAAANELQQANEQNLNGANGNGIGDRINFDRNLVNVCVNLNENAQTKIEPTPSPTTATLTVTKTTNCQFGSGVCGPINPQITVAGVNPNPNSFLASQTPVDVALGAGQYSVSEDGFVPGLPQCTGFQGGQLISGQILDFYMCTNFSANCEGNISVGQDLSCTIENTVILVD